MPLVAALVGFIVAGCDSSPAVRPTGAARPAVIADSGPTVPDFSVWRPFFYTGARDHSIAEITGTAFAVEGSDQTEPLLVTAVHLIDSSSESVDAARAVELRKSVSDIVLTDTFGATDGNFDAGAPVELDSGSVPEFAEFARQLVVFSAGAGRKRVRPLPLAEQVLEVGDELWLSTAVFAGAPPSQTTHMATVTQRDPAGYLSYTFENSRLSLESADGAPLLDDQGRVVGIHLHDRSEEGKVAGQGLAAEPLRRWLERWRTGDSQDQ